MKYNATKFEKLKMVATNLNRRHHHLVQDLSGLQ